jgi:hypothetical protein
MEALYMAYLFCGFLALVEVLIAGFVGHIWHKAASPNSVVSAQWRWTSEDSRDMWVDAAKTMITAAGIAAALVASLGLGLTRAVSLFFLRNEKVSAVCLVTCVCSSMALILALSRGHEAAKSRYLLEQRTKGNMGKITEGALSNFALRIILLLSFVALSSFFIGFAFLARIVWDS